MAQLVEDHGAKVPPAAAHVEHDHAGRDPRPEGAQARFVDVAPGGECAAEVFLPAVCDDLDLAIRRPAGCLRQPCDRLARRLHGLLGGLFRIGAAFEPHANLVVAERAPFESLVEIAD